MKKVFLIHGFEGSPNGGWRPWLMGELDKKDIYACALPMPSPENPICSEWIEEIRSNVERNDNDEIYLVGHSLGVPAILQYLQITHFRNIKGIILVSGPAHKNDNRKIDSFLEQPFDFKLILSKIKNCAVIHGDDDPLVPLSDAEELSKELKGKLFVVKNGGHLSSWHGAHTLQHALDSLLEMMELI